MSTYCIHLYTYFVTDALVCAQCSGCLFPLIITHLFVFYVNTMCCTNFFTSSLSRPSVLQNHPSLVSFSAFPHQPQIYQLSMQISEECGEQAARTLNLPLRARSNFFITLYYSNYSLNCQTLHASKWNRLLLTSQAHRWFQSCSQCICSIPILEGKSKWRRRSTQTADRSLHALPAVSCSPEVDRSQRTSQRREQRETTLPRSLKWRQHQLLEM